MKSFSYDSTHSALYSEVCCRKLKESASVIEESNNVTPLRITKHAYLFLQPRYRVHPSGTSSANVSEVRVNGTLANRR